MSSRTLERLREKSESAVEAEAYIIDKRFYVGYKGLAAIFGVQPTSIQGMKRKGLEIAEVSLPRLNLFDVDRSINWFKNNTDLSRATRRLSAPQVETGEEEENPYSDVDLDKVPKAEAERRKEIEAVKKLILQNKALEGESIPIDDVDKNMATQAATHISHLTNSEKILPDLLENKSASDIQEILNDHNQKQIEQLYRITNSNIDSDAELYDVIQKVIDKIDLGVGVDAIMKGIDKVAVS